MGLYFHLVGIMEKREMTGKERNKKGDLRRPKCFHNDKILL